MDKQSDKDKIPRDLEEAIEIFSRSLAKEREEALKQRERIEKQYEKYIGKNFPMDNPMRALFAQILTSQIRAISQDLINYGNLQTLLILLNWQHTRSKGNESETKKAQTQIRNLNGELKRARKGLKWAQRFGIHFPGTSTD